LRDDVLVAGADGFLDKPVASVAVFQETILAHLPREVQPRGPRPINTETLAPDPIALRDDLTHVAELLDADPNGDTLDYLAQFLGGVAVSADDGPLLAAARAMRTAQQSGGATKAAMDQLTSILRDRLMKVEAL
jgi:hypothetical protein